MNTVKQQMGMGPKRFNPQYWFQSLLPHTGLVEETVCGFCKLRDKSNRRGSGLGKWKLVWPLAPGFSILLRKPRQFLNTYMLVLAGSDKV